MYKIHLQDNKENVLGFSIFLGFILLMIVNVVVLTPQLIRVYSPRPKIEGALLIDTDTVNKAVEYLQ